MAGTPTAANAYKLIYQARATHLSASVTTSNMLTNNPDLMLYAALLESAPFLHNDARLPMWAELYSTSMKSIKKQDFRMRTGGGAIRVRPDGITP